MVAATFPGTLSMAAAAGSFLVSVLTSEHMTAEQASVRLGLDVDAVDEAEDWDVELCDSVGRTLDVPVWRVDLGLPDGPVHANLTGDQLKQLKAIMERRPKRASIQCTGKIGRAHV